MSIKMTTGQAITFGDGKLACGIGEVYDVANRALGEDIDYILEDGGFID